MRGGAEVMTLFRRFTQNLYVATVARRVVYHCPALSDGERWPVKFCGDRPGFDLGQPKSRGQWLLRRPMQSKRRWPRWLFPKDSTAASPSYIAFKWHATIAWPYSVAAVGWIVIRIAELRAVVRKPSSYSPILVVRSKVLLIQSKWPKSMLLLAQRESALPLGRPCRLLPLHHLRPQNQILSRKSYNFKPLWLEIQIRVSFQRGGCMS
ncbi:hypothetical protein FPV67DRAFT_516279 [Lyophyllum atratum]|nr:hypothetical protein FPV67DRAFT_516279 [Lyophyllum atratum]